MDTEPLTCPTCHHSVLPAYYFCPNCGTKLKAPPLSTSLEAQLKVYAHSLILPLLVFITIGKWHGVQYLKSEDPKAKNIGLVALALLVFSTVLVVWYTRVLTQSLSQSLTNSINADMGGY